MAKREKTLCDECQINPEEILLVNGEDVDRLCPACFKQALADLVLSNGRIAFSTGTGPGGLLTVQVER